MRSKFISIFIIISFYSIVSFGQDLVSRSLSPTIYQPGDTITVTLTYDKSTITDLAGAKQSSIKDVFPAELSTIKATNLMNISSVNNFTPSDVIAGQVRFGFFDDPAKTQIQFSYELVIPGTVSGDLVFDTISGKMSEVTIEYLNANQDDIAINQTINQVANLDQNRAAEITNSLDDPTADGLGIAQDTLGRQLSHGTNTGTFVTTFIALGAPTKATFDNFLLRIIKANENGGSNTPPWTVPGTATLETTPTLGGTVTSTTAGWIDITSATDLATPINNTQSINSTDFTHMFFAKVDTPSTNNRQVQVSWSVPDGFIPLTDGAGEVYIMQIRSTDSTNSLEQTSEWAFNVLPNQKPVVAAIAISGGTDTSTSATVDADVSASDVDDPELTITFVYSWEVNGSEIASASGSVTGTRTMSSDPWTATIPGLDHTNFQKNDQLQLMVTATNTLPQSSDAVSSNTITVGNTDIVITNSANVTVTVTPPDPVFNSSLTVGETGLVAEINDEDIADTVDTLTKLFEWFRSTDSGANYASVKGPSTSTTLAPADFSQTKFDKGDQFKVELTASDTTTPITNPLPAAITSNTVTIQNSAPTGEDKAITVSTGLAKTFSLAIADDDQDPLSIDTIIAVPEDEDMVSYQSSLSQANEITISSPFPNATGSATFTIDLVNDTIAYNISYSTLSQTVVDMAHIHGPATVCENGGVIFDLSLGDAATNLPSPIMGMWDYTDFDFSGIAGINSISGFETAIIGGLTYVNLHTAMNTGGEVRGQIVPTMRKPVRTGGTAHVAVLNQSKEVASAIVVTNNDAEGEGTFVIDTEMDTVSYYITYENLTGEATFAHIHGPAGEGTAADELFTLNLGSPASNPPSPITGTWDYSGFTGATGIANKAELETALTSGNTYVNIHTVSNTDGEIRGQIETERNFEAELNGRQEVPPNNSIGKGFGEFTINVAANTLTYNINFSDLVTTGTTPGTTVAHIHGPANTSEVAGLGKINGVLFDLNIGTALFMGNLNGTWDYTDGETLTDQEIQDREDAILNGKTYVNIHSDQFPGGEIRGQITPFVFRLNESIELDSVTNSAASYTFNPGNAVDGDTYQFTYRVKDDDHLASDVHTVTLNVVDNLPPEVVTDSAMPDPDTNITGSNEGTEFPFTVTATDSNDPSGTGAIAEIEWFIDNVSSRVDSNTGNAENFVASFNWVTDSATIFNVDGHRPRSKTFMVTATIKDNLGAITNVVWTVVLGDVDQDAVAPVNSITPDPAQTENALMAVIDTVSTDPDGDAIVGYQHSWENITTSAAAVPGDTLANDQFVKGNTVRLTSKALTDPYDEVDDIVSSNAGTKEITISNTAPIATPQQVATDEDTDLAIDLDAVDLDVVDSVDTLTFALVNQPTNGTLVNLNTATGTVTYKPNTNFHGTDSFTFTAGDGSAVSDPATVSLVIHAVNDNPTVENLTSFSKANNAATDPKNFGQFTMTGDDIDNTSGKDSSNNDVSDDDVNSLKYQLETTFRVTIQNLSSTSTLAQSACPAGNPAGGVPFSGGVWAVHTIDNPIFQSGEADFNEGLEALAEDGNVGKLSSMLATKSGVTSSNAFGDTGPGAVTEFTFSALPGERLSFATMFVPSNDLFLAPGGNGIDLFNGNMPINQEITTEIALWDAGTEVNQEPGVGSEQVQCQGEGGNIGTIETGGVVRLVSASGDGFTYPAVGAMMKVTIATVTTFTVTIENKSTTDTLAQSTCDPGGNPAGAVPLSFGVWAVHSIDNPIFENNVTDIGEGLEALAEDGNSDTLAASLAAKVGVSSSNILSNVAPGNTIQFTFSALPGERLSLASMFVPSNDLFYAPGGNGLDPFSFALDGSTTDITDQFNLWDAGTEINEAPGAGLHQAQCQAANTPDDRGSEGGTVQLVPITGDTFTYPATGDVIGVTIVANGINASNGAVRHSGGANLTPGEMITGLETLEFVPNNDVRGLVVLRYLAQDRNGGFSPPASIRMTVGTPPWFPFIDLSEFTNPTPVGAGETYRVLIELDPGNGQLQEILKTTVRTTADKTNVGPIDYIQANNSGLQPTTMAGGDYSVTVSKFNTTNMMFEQVGTARSPLFVDVYSDATISRTVVPEDAVFDAVNEVWNFTFELDTVSAYKFSVKLQNPDTTIVDLIKVIQPTDDDVIQLSGEFKENGVFLEAAGGYLFTITPINPKNLAGDSGQAQSESLTVSANDAVVVTVPPAGVDKTTLSPGILQLNPDDPNFVVAIASADNGDKALVTLQWSRVGKAKDYFVYVATVGGMVVEIPNNGNTNGNNFFQVSLAPGQYRWHVITRNDIGLNDIWSPPVYFQIDPEPTFTTPILKNVKLKNAVQVGDGTVTFVLEWVIRAQKAKIGFFNPTASGSFTSTIDVPGNDELILSNVGFDVAQADAEYLFTITPLLEDGSESDNTTIRTYIPAAPADVAVINKLSIQAVDTTTPADQINDSINITGFANGLLPTSLEFEASIRRFGATSTTGFEAFATNSPITIGAPTADTIPLTLFPAVFAQQPLLANTITIVKIRVRGRTTTVTGPWSRQSFFVVEN